MALQWVCLGLFLAYYSFEVVLNLRAFPRIVAAIEQGRLKRTQLYARLLAGLWIPVLPALLLAALGSFSWSDIGLGWRDFETPDWLFGVSCALAGAYFLYLMYSLFAMRARCRKGDAGGRGIPERMKPMLPVSWQEKRVWAVTSVFVGFSEELMFRGFIIYLLAALFPTLPLAAVLVASATLFGAGHLYQGPAEAVKPALIGLLFGVFYISFGTIWPCVALHALQDMCSVYAL